MIHDEGYDYEVSESGSGFFQTQSWIFTFLDNFFEKRAIRDVKKRSFIGRIFSKETWNWNKMSRWATSALNCGARKFYSESMSYAEDTIDLEKGSLGYLSLVESGLICMQSKYDMRILVEDMIDNAVSMVNKFQQSDEHPIDRHPITCPFMKEDPVCGYNEVTSSSLTEVIVLS